VLAVDLDGTLIFSDLFRLSILRLLSSNPLYLLIIPFWLCRGRAALKRSVAQRVEIDPAELAYRAEVLEYVRAQQQDGRRTVLATGSDEQLARLVATYLDCFDEVLASDGHRNCTGSTKARLLVQQYGLKKFDYIGNSRVDWPVWEQAAGVLVASKSSRFCRRVERQFEVLHVFS
jgi:phosphoserine phosphatase